MTLSYSEIGQKKISPVLWFLDMENQKMQKFTDALKVKKHSKILRIIILTIVFFEMSLRKCLFLEWDS